MTDIDRLAELHAKTTQIEWRTIADSYTPPEWFVVAGPGIFGQEIITGPSEPITENHDFAFIAAAHNELPHLLAELRRLREFEATVRTEWDKLNVNGLLLMESNLMRAIEKLDEQRKARP